MIRIAPYGMLVLCLASLASVAAPRQVDVVVAGGTERAVETAISEKAAGRSVLLLAPRPYLGEDAAGTLLCLADGITPLEAKRRLDRRMIAAGVEFLSGAVVTDVRKGDRGFDLTYAVRGGERTLHTTDFRDMRVPVPASCRRFARIVVSGSRPKGEGLAVEALPDGYTVPVTNRVEEGGDGSVRLVHGRAWRCEFTLPFAVTDAVSRAEADRIARDLTWTPDILDGADELIALESAQPHLRTSSAICADVAVAGGGVAGAPAAIAAARCGRRTVVCEALHMLGGMGTAGGIGQYWQGCVRGFTEEYDRKVRSLACAVHAVGKREAWRRMCRDAGATVLFGAVVYGVRMEKDRIAALKVATDYGPVEISAKAFVDATGCASVAAAAGALTVFQEDGPLCLQGAGVAPRPLGVGFVNSDFGYVDVVSPQDSTRFAACGRLGAPAVWDVASLIGARERRRIVGDVTVSPEDVRRGRRFGDVVVQCRSNFDSHGPTACDLGLLAGPGAQRFFAFGVPYRAFLPKGLSGVVVPGLGMAAARDAMPVLRMQPDVQNAGYAAGHAAAAAAMNGGDFRAVDVRKLQEHLVACGNIDADVLSWRDVPLSDDELRSAIVSLVPDYQGAEIVLAERNRALPFLRAAFAAATEPRARLVYAHSLGVLGCADGADVLADWLEGRIKADEPDFRCKWAFARRFPYRESVIVALGRTRTARARAFLERSARDLDQRTPFFRFRAVCWALETCGDKASSAMLLEVARRPGVTGHVKPGLEAWRPLFGYTSKRYSMTDEEIAALRELDLATAVYRLSGDASLLEPWLSDGRSVFSDYAENVLGVKSAASATPRSSARGRDFVMTEKRRNT